MITDRLLYCLTIQLRQHQPRQRRRRSRHQWRRRRRYVITTLCMPWSSQGRAERSLNWKLQISATGCSTADDAALPWCCRHWSRRWLHIPVCADTCLLSRNTGGSDDHSVDSTATGVARFPLLLKRCVSFCCSVNTMIRPCPAPLLHDAAQKVCEVGFVVHFL